MYEQVQAAFGPGAPGTLQIVSPSAEAAEVTKVLSAAWGIADVASAPVAGRQALVLAQPKVDPSDPALGTAIEGLRDALPADALVGGVAAAKQTPHGRQARPRRAGDRRAQCPSRCARSPR